MHHKDACNLCVAWAPNNGALRGRWCAPTVRQITVRTSLEHVCNLPAQLRLIFARQLFGFGTKSACLVELIFWRRSNKAGGFDKSGGICCQCS
jgi:hypothetical protein